MFKINEHNEPTAKQIATTRMIAQSKRIQKRMAELAAEDKAFRARNK